MTLLGDGWKTTAESFPMLENSITLYIGGAVTRTVTYYPAGGAMRIDGNVYYVLKDRLGSAYATTDASGNVVGEMRYYAFGETRLSTGTMFTDRLYTGQRQIAELGVYHYNARFYSPTLGRFLSADSIMSGMANPQNLNRFSYVANNPLRYTDPTGHMMSVGDDGGGGSYTTSPIADYCSTHPSVCSGGSGGSDDDGGGGDDGGAQDEPPGHEYLVPPIPVCLNTLPWIDCTESEMADYKSRFQYPGQWPGSPVEDEHSYDVWPAKFWGIPNPILWALGMGDSGAIEVDITDDPLTIANRTRSSHIFHEGYVESTVYQLEGGNWYVTTYGVGTNDGYSILPGSLIDNANEQVGPIVFTAIAYEMLAYTTVVETGQYINTQISGLLP